MAITRRQAREDALQLLYAHEVSGNPVQDIVKNTSIIPSRQDGSSFDDFTVKLVKKTAKSSKECEKFIKKHAQNWDLNRIALIDKLVLRIAMTEFLCFPDIPPKVTINEALEVAKRFSTGKSVKFINGILNAVHEELLAGNETKKL